jgi:hypothetical protein
MRKWTLVAGLVAALAFGVGCKKKEEATKPATPPPSAADAAAAPTPPPAPAPDAAPAGGGSAAGGSTGKMEGKMANCPSSVEGATTTVEQGKDAVEVTVVGKDDKATKEIRDRSKKLAEASKAPEGAEVKHEGKGTGGGGTGYCPVVLQGTSVEYAEVNNGAKLTVKPDKADGLKALFDESKRRNENMPKAGAGGGGGTGGGEGKPGPGGPGSGTGGGGGTGGGEKPAPTPGPAPAGGARQM